MDTKTVNTKMIGTKKNTFHLELKKKVATLEDLDDIDNQNKNMTEIIQQSATIIIATGNKT